MAQEIVEKSFSVFYSGWLDNVKAMLTTKFVEEKTTQLERKWLLGKEIIDNIPNFDRAEIYGQKLIKKISNDLKMSDREVYRCKKFYVEHPAEDFAIVAESLPLNAKWSRISGAIREISGHSHEYQEATYWRCKVCDKKLFSKPE